MIVKIAISFSMKLYYGTNYYYQFSLSGYNYEIFATPTNFSFHCFKKYLSCNEPFKMAKHELILSKYLKMNI